ncbi:MAG: GGDEF domain-containing protein [Trueperaceae bacterium]
MRRSSWIITGVFAVLIGLSLAGVGFVAFTIPAAAVTLALVMAVQAPRRLPWLLATIGSGLWAVEEIAWALRRSAGIVEASFVTEFAYYAGVAAWLAALWMMPGRRFTRTLWVPLIPAVGMLVWLMLLDPPATLTLQFPIADGILALAALSALEPTLRGRASEGRLLLALAFYVRGLSAATLSWLFDVGGLLPGFYVLWLLGYALLALGAHVELADVPGELFTATTGIVTLQLATGTLLLMLFMSDNLSNSYGVVFLSLLAYIEVGALMLILVSDRRRRMAAETELRSWAALLDRVSSVDPGAHDSRPTVSRLLDAVTERMPSLRGLVLHDGGGTSVGAAEGYAYPLVAGGTEIGRLYFAEQPQRSNVLDAVAPFLAARIQQTADQEVWRTHATTDPLTGLLNRRGLEHRADALVMRARSRTVPVSVAMLDLDHFKRVNDLYDHATGDKALKELATLLGRHLRPHDLAVRWGGEEFVVVLYDADRATAADVVRRIRQELRERVVRPISWTLTFSAGLAGGGVPTDEGAVHAWIAEADAALKQAKDAGRDRVENAAT